MRSSSRPGVAQNLTANLLGTVWGTAIGLVAVPLYLHFLGAEGYGLIGFYTVLASLLSMLDAGFSAAAAWQLARQVADGIESRAQAAKTVQVLERAFLALGAFAGLIVILLAPVAATRWLNVQHLGTDSAVRAIRLMGLSLILQFPLALYSACLLGLQRHALMNAVTVGTSTARAAGSLLLLWLVSPSVEAFFAWQIAVNMVGVLAARGMVHRLMPEIRHAPAGLDRLRGLSHFALGMGGINLLGIALTQVDKVVLSYLLPLRQFGYYMLAWTLSALVYRLSMPVYNAVLPRMTQLAAVGGARLAALFQASGQLMAVLAVPFSLFLATFSPEILHIWTGDVALAQADRSVLALLAAGTMISALMQIPFALQIAHARVRPLFLMNLAAVCALAPLIAYLALRHGIEGAAVSWLLLNGTLFCVMVRLVSACIDRRALGQWLFTALVVPVLAAGTMLLVAKVLVAQSQPEGRALIAALAIAGIAAQLGAAFSSPFVRERVTTFLGPGLRDANGTKGPD